MVFDNSEARKALWDGRYREFILHAVDAFVGNDQGHALLYFLN